MRNLTKSGKTLPTIILIIIPSIATVLGLIITVLAPALFERTTPAAGVGFFVVIVYIFYPRSAKYFKKREYQKGIDEFQYIKKIILVGIIILSALLIALYGFHISRSIFIF